MNDGLYQRGAFAKDLGFRTKANEAYLSMYDGLYKYFLPPSDADRTRSSGPTHRPPAMVAPIRFLINSHLVFTADVGDANAGAVERVRPVLDPLFENFENTSSKAGRFTNFLWFLSYAAGKQPRIKIHGLQTTHPDLKSIADTRRTNTTLTFECLEPGRKGWFWTPSSAKCGWFGPKTDNMGRQIIGDNEFKRVTFADWFLELEKPRLLKQWNLSFHFNCKAFVHDPETEIEWKVEQHRRTTTDQKAQTMMQTGELLREANWKSSVSRMFIMQVYLSGIEHPTVNKLQRLRDELSERLRAKRDNADDVDYQLVLGKLEDAQRDAKFRKIEESGTAAELASALDSEMGIEKPLAIGNGHAPGTNGHSATNGQGSLDLGGIDNEMGGFNDGTGSQAGGDGNTNAKDNGFEDALEKIRLSKMRGKKDTMPAKVATSTAARCINDMIKCYDKDMRAVNAEKPALHKAAYVAQVSSLCKQ